MAKSLDDLKKDIDALSRQYEALTSTPAALFNITNVKDATSAVNTLQGAILAAQRQAADLDAGFGSVRDTLQAIVSELSKTVTPVNLATSAFKKMLSSVEKLKYDQQGINTLNLKQLKAEQEKQKLFQQTVIDQAKLVKEKHENLLLDKNGKALHAGNINLRLRHLVLTKNINEEEAAILLGLSQNFTIFKQINDLIDKRLIKEKQFQKSLGISGAIAKLFGQIPGLGGAMSEALEKTEKQMSALDAAGKPIPGRLRTMVMLLGNMKGAVKDALTDPFTIFVTIIKVFKELDKSTEDLARGMNMTYSEAASFRNELKAGAYSLGNMNVSSKGLLETNLAINGALGTSVKLNDKNTALFTELRVAAGLTNEELLGINNLTTTNGKTFKENTEEILAQAKITGLGYKVKLNEKEVLTSIGKVSAATTLTLAKNPGLISKAVATAKSLGYELDQVDRISQSLLNFQSSIENELAAELLTGKQLNLETARYAALTGDVATVASEVAREVGTAAEFGAMNVLAQESVAAAVGLGREDLAKALYIQEQLVGLSAEEAKAEGDLLASRIESTSLAEVQKKMGEEGIEGLKEQAGIATSFNLIVEKLKENFVLIGTAVLPIVNALASFVGYIAESPALLGAIVGVLTTIKVLQAAIAISAIAAGVGASGGLAALAIVAGITAGVAVVNNATAGTKANDLYSGGTGNSGYGKRTLLAPEGAFALNNKDNIIATTNPINVNDMISGPKSSINPSPQRNVSQPQQVKSDINITPGNTKISLNLNGTVVGNVNATQDYSVGKNVKAFGGNFDYSAGF